MPDRNYSKAFDIHRSAPVFPYVWDDAAVITGAGNLPNTGCWRPVTADDYAAGGGGGGGATDMGPTILAIAGTLLNINGFSSNTGTQYIHVYDNWNSGANLISTFLIDGNNNFGIDFGPQGISMASGIFVCNSSTLVTQTNGANDLFLTVSYK